MMSSGHVSIWLMLAGGAAGAADPCACIYASGLPAKYWTGGKYEALGMISAYGTACSPWDSIPDTPWYSGSCNTTAGKDYCTKADSWCDDSWCYVDKACPTWTATTVFKDVADAPKTLGYSYQKCGSKNCYSDTNAAGCPDDAFGSPPRSDASDFKLSPQGFPVNSEQSPSDFNFSPEGAHVASTRSPFATSSLTLSNSESVCYPSVGDAPVANDTGPKLRESGHMIAQTQDGGGSFDERATHSDASWQRRQDGESDSDGLAQPSASSVSSSDRVPDLQRSSQQLHTRQDSQFLSVDESVTCARGSLPLPPANVAQNMGPGSCEDRPIARQRALPSRPDYLSRRTPTTIYD